MLDLSRGLSSLLDLAALPRRPDGVDQATQLALAAAEEEIREDFTAYGYAYDSGDIDRVMWFFSDDCVITNPRGRVAGVDAIRSNYRLLFDYWKVTRHLWCNVTVRFSAADEAYLGAYHYAMLVSDERALAGVGLDLRRLRPVDGRWKIVERWITDDIDYAISVHSGAVEDPQKVNELVAGQ
jgi:hypothetical protein